MLSLPVDVYDQMVAHCISSLPEEGCGLLAAPPGTEDVAVCYPTGNAEASARLYSIDSLELLKIDRDAESRGLDIVGVFHSHTHTDAYPSPTDVAQAPDPNWHYVLVSLKLPDPVVRSFRIVEGEITEEPVTVGNG